MHTLPRPALALTLLFAFTACDRPGLPLTLSAETLKDGAEVIVRAKTAEGATVRVNDQEKVANARGVADLRFPMTSFKMGKQKLTVQATKDEQKATVEAEVERDAIPAALKVAMGSPPAPYVTVDCSGQFCETPQLRASAAGKMPLQLHTAAGTTVEIDGQKLVAAKGDEMLTLDFAPRMADTELPFQSTMAQKIALPVRLRSADEVALEGTLDIGANLLEGMVSLHLQTVTQGPVRFGDEPEAAGSARSLALVNGTRMDQLLGNAKRVRDIDLVALIQYRESRPAPGQCGPYTGRGANSYATRAAVDGEVVVYERRTGKKLQTRTFPAGQDPCPESLYGKESSLVVTSYPKMEPIVAWLKGQIRG